MSDSPYINYFAETDYRGKRTKFGIKAEDRARHVYVIGKTGMGKSTVLENMAIQDIQRGEGLAFIDPHGGTAEKLLDYIPAERVKDVIYVAPHDLDFPVAFNIMENMGKDKNYLVANGLMATFKKIWPDVWSARMEYILNNVLLSLLEYPNSTILGVNRMLADKDYRDAVVANVTDPSVKSFWLDEFANYTERMAAESVPAIQNKIGQFTSNPLIRNIIGQPKSTFDLRDVMDKKKILIMNLSKGRVGEINANLLGGMLITKIYLAAMSRADKNASELASLPPFYFYVDEFQSFVNDTFADILSEARKYKLALTIAHQYIEQMPEAVRDAVFGNVGTTLAYRVGPFDAEVLEKLFTPKFLIEDIVSLGRFQMYLTLMINGVGSPPFSARGMPPIPPPAESIRELVIEHSREAYARPRAEVEADVGKWHEAVHKAEGTGGTGRANGLARPGAGIRKGNGSFSRPGGGSGPGREERENGPSRSRGGASGSGGFGRPVSGGGNGADRAARQSSAPPRPAFGVGSLGGSREPPSRREPSTDTFPNAVLVEPAVQNAISLSSLAQKDNGTTGSGEVSGGQHLNDLRSALKQVLNGHSATTSPSSPAPHSASASQPVPAPLASSPPFSSSASLASPAPAIQREGAPPRGDKPPPGPLAHSANRSKLLTHAVLPGKESRDSQHRRSGPSIPPSNSFRPEGVNKVEHGPKMGESREQRELRPSEASREGGLRPEAQKQPPREIPKKVLEEMLAVDMPPFS